MPEVPDVDESIRAELRIRKQLQQRGQATLKLDLDRLELLSRGGFLFHRLPPPLKQRRLGVVRFAEVSREAGLSSGGLWKLPRLTAVVEGPRKARPAFGRSRRPSRRPPTTALENRPPSAGRGRFPTVPTVPTTPVSGLPFFSGETGETGDSAMDLDSFRLHHSPPGSAKS